MKMNSFKNTQKNWKRKKKQTSLIESTDNGFKGRNGRNSFFSDESDTSAALLVALPALFVLLLLLLLFVDFPLFTLTLDTSKFNALIYNNKNNNNNNKNNKNNILLNYTITKKKRKRINLLVSGRALEFYLDDVYHWSHSLCHSSSQRLCRSTCVISSSSSSLSSMQSRLHAPQRRTAPNRRHTSINTMSVECDTQHWTYLFVDMTHVDAAFLQQMHVRGRFAPAFTFHFTRQFRSGTFTFLIVGRWFVHFGRVSKE